MLPQPKLPVRGPARHVRVHGSCQSVIRGIQQDIRSKKRSAAEVVQQYLDAIAAAEPSVHSYITVNAQQALNQAHQVDAHISSHGMDNLPPLAGVPIAIKDNICTAGVRTTAGSRILDRYVPTYDATAAARLRSAGAALLGKTNMDEFGMGSSTENSAYKATTNPWDVTRVPGGSSGGSAAAVAAHECAGSLGSDTGGSIRQPAHFCGVVGLKPSYGRVSRYGLIAYASSLDVIGTLAHTVEDAALLLDVISGPDAADATCSNKAPSALAAGLAAASAQHGSRPLQSLRIGLIAETLGEGVEAAVNDAVASTARQLEALGAVVEEVSLPSFGAGLPAYYVLATSEASSNLSRYDGVRYGVPASASDLQSLYRGTRGAGLGPEVQRRILMGTYALSAGYYDAYYKRAQQVRTMVSQEMSNALARFDALLLPTAPSTAYRLGEKTSDPLSMYKGDLMTVNVNLAGLPAIVLPVAYAPNPSGSPGDVLPIGIQLVGRMMGELELIRLAHTLEQSLPTPPSCIGNGQTKHQLLQQQELVGVR